MPLTYDHHCPARLQYHTRPHLVQHLSRPTSLCLSTLIHVYPPLTLAQACEHTTHDKQHERRPRDNQSLRLHGLSARPMPRRNHNQYPVNDDDDADDTAKNVSQPGR